MTGAHLKNSRTPALRAGAAGLLPLCLLATTAAAPAGRTPVQGPQYLYQYEQTGLSILITVNEVDADEHGVESMHPSGGGPLNMWLRPGKNSLRVRGKVVKDGKDKERPPKLELSIWSQVGDDRATRKTVARLAWPSPGAVPATVDQELTFVPQPPPPSELWSRAEVVKLDAAARAAIVGFVAELHAAFARRDVERVMALTELRDLDLARCLYIPGDRVRKHRRDDMEEEIRNVWRSGWKIRPLERADLVLDLVEGGRLVAVTARGKPAISIDMGEAKFEMPVYVARVGGKWVLGR
jgi:hypothetical protein